METNTNCKKFSVEKCPIPICTKKARPPMGPGSKTDFYCGANTLTGINNYCKKIEIDECPSPFCIKKEHDLNTINKFYCGIDDTKNN